MKTYLLIFLGGGVGSLLRYTAGRLVPATLTGAPFPYAILPVNVLASAVLGFVIGDVLTRAVGEEVRLLVGVGFCEGLSTFSSFIQEMLVLLQNGRMGAALPNIGLNLATAGRMAIEQRM